MAPPMSKGEPSMLTEHAASISAEAYIGWETPDVLWDLVLRVFRGRIAVVSSFGAESAVLPHLAAEIDRDIPVIFLDTGKLFPETIEYRDLLMRRLGLRNVRSVQPGANLPDRM